MKASPIQAIAAAALALAGAASSAHAQTGHVLASDPQGIATLMQAAGYRAEITTDGDGDPKILSSAEGANFSVYFYGCTTNKNCQSIQFSAGFDLDSGLTLEQANDWNTNKRFGKVYLDDDWDPRIEMDINLAYGGVSEKNMRETLDIWSRLLAAFLTHIDW